MTVFFTSDLHFGHRNEGRWLLHGHTHGEERVTHTVGQIARPYGVREIHVGVDAWDLTPVSLETIASLIKEQEE